MNNTMRFSRITSRSEVVVVDGLGVAREGSVTVDCLLVGRYHHQERE